jgi:hypothetical protein
MPAFPVTSSDPSLSCTPQGIQLSSTHESVAVSIEAFKNRSRQFVWCQLPVAVAVELLEALGKAAPGSGPW